jgi:general secretion pathway protein E
MTTEPVLALTFSYAKRHGVLIGPEQSVFHKASVSPGILIEIQRYLQQPVFFKEIADEEFDKLLIQSYENTTDTAMHVMEGMQDHEDLAELVQALPNTEDLLDTQNDAPIIRLLNALISEAIKQGASDIHIEPFEDKLMVRFRIDGILREILQPQRALIPLIISRIKVMAKLDIAEKRLPQDGRITVRIGGRTIDVRVSTLPESYGERVVMRLLDKKNAILDLASLGMAPGTLASMREVIARPHGIILVTGPTGSGKSTTLYAALSAINDRKSNILTVEDPIEYYLPGIGQTQVNYKVDMTFARGLRAILRQDPDVIMVGEIRDLETAKIAVQASLTGHLVLSTLHTNTAIGAITRLEDMGVEAFLLSSSIIGILAQRLVRILCIHCKKPLQADAQDMKVLGLNGNTPSPTIYQAVGCEHCNHTGFRGRTGIYELIVVDEKCRDMIHRGATEQELDTYAHKKFPTMRKDGCRVVLAGITTLEEVLRVTVED